MGQHDPSSNDSRSGDIFSEGAKRTRTNRVLEKPITDLSYEERLLIHRRRQDLTQAEMAKRLGVSRKTYSRLERGLKTEVRPDTPSVEPLRDHEQCMIMRRRAGWSQEMCAEQLGVSRYWFRLMEMGQAGCEKLVGYWNENG